MCLSPQEHVFMYLTKRLFAFLVNSMKPDLIKFKFGEVVYRLTSEMPGQFLRLIYAPDGSVMYEVKWQDGVKEELYDIELTVEKPYGMSIVDDNHD